MLSKPINFRNIYCDPEIFNEEQAQLFSEQWIYAGLTHKLKSHNDFIRVRLLKLDIIVQNLHGTLRAFINVCSHRYSIIHDQPCGNKSLTCPYHGWHYDDRGVPRGIPCKEDFPEVTANPEAFRLQDLELAQAGDFIFLRVNKGGTDLRTFLGDAFTFLEQVSSSLGNQLDEQQATIQANWKLVIENSLEGYHVPLVHRESLAKASQIQFSQDSGDSMDYLPETGHSYVHNVASKKWLQRWSRYQKDIGQWPFMFEHYVHRLVFPNLTVTSFLGYSFHIQLFNPDAVDSTTVHSSIFASKFDGRTARGKSIMQSIYNENVYFTHIIFDEDRLACERTHAGARQAFRPSVLGKKLEARVVDFRLTYHRLQPNKAK
ncbi:MAG TPA: aromatic ring-hydroxylating dioxygenase subunit alpha [Methyloradius sp.]